MQELFFGAGAQGPQGVTGAQGFQGNQGITGAQGPQGIQGFQGFQGATGSTGTQGPQGFQGAQGSDGPQGNVGAQGPQGFQGATGSQGFQGTQGVAGLTGAQGNQGSQGTTGAQGPQGFQGNQGTTGSTGPQGNQGFQGDTGATGPQGTQGNQGTQGSQGFQGVPGTAGTDNIYTTDGSIPAATIRTVTIADDSELLINDAAEVVQIKVRPGEPDLFLSYFGSPEQVFLALSAAGLTIQLVDTAIEINGDYGTAGQVLTSNGAGVPNTWETVTGTQGPQGAQGPQGTTGATGSQGDAGAQGPQGAQGSQGSSSAAITCVFDGMGSALVVGSKVYLEVPFGMTITGWTIIADVSGSVVIDVWKDTYANYPPVVGDSIAGTEKPTLSTAIKNQDLSLTTWTTTTIAAGDTLVFNVDSATTVTKVTVVLRGVKT